MLMLFRLIPAAELSKLVYGPKLAKSVPSVAGIRTWRVNEDTIRQPYLFLIAKSTSRAAPRPVFSNIT